jgi:hypothetical protein
VFGDPNRDNNDLNDRLPGYGRNAFVGPDYATTDFRLARRIPLGSHLKSEFLIETFNLFNRNNKRVTISDQGFLNSAGKFLRGDKLLGVNYFPGYYQRPANFLAATNAYAPRQIQLALRLIF